MSIGSAPFYTLRGHLSIGSPAPYRIGSSRLTSRSVRPAVAKASASPLGPTPAAAPPGWKQRPRSIGNVPVFDRKVPAFDGHYSVFELESARTRFECARV